MKYRPLNLSEVERDALVATLNCILNIERDNEYGFLASNKAGLVVIEHIRDKLTELRLPIKSKVKD